MPDAVASRQHGVVWDGILVAAIVDALAARWPAARISRNGDRPVVYERAHERLRLVLRQRLPAGERDADPVRRVWLHRASGGRLRGPIWELSVRGHAHVPHGLKGKLRGGPATATGAAAVPRILNAINERLDRETRRLAQLLARPRRRALQELRLHRLHRCVRPATPTKSSLVTNLRDLRFEAVIRTAVNAIVNCACLQRHLTQSTST